MKFKLIILLVVTFLILIIGVGNWGLTESSEARYAEISKEMVSSGNYFEPTLLGIKHFHKPPVTYYITSLGYKLFGINEFGARFFLQIALIFQIIFVYLIAMLLYKKEKIAFAAAFIYISFPLVLISVRNLTTDAFLNTFTLAALYFWLSYRKGDKAYFLYLFYIFIGLIFDTKGPVGLIIPITFIITTKIIYKEKIQHTFHQYFGLLLFFIISSSWFLFLFQSNHGLLDYFFNHQIVDRIAVDKFNRSKPFWYYIVLVPFGGFPLLFLLFANGKSYFLSIFKQKTLERSLVISFLLLLIVLSLSTSKLILYALPLYSLLALLIANKLEEVSEKWISIFTKIYFVFIGIIIIGSLSISFIKTDFTIDIFSTLIAAIIITIVLIIITRSTLSKRLKLLYIGYLFMFTLIVESNLFFKNNEIVVNSMKPIATFIKETNNKPKTVIVYNTLLPSISFYLDEQIITVNNGYYTTQREIYFESNKNWKKYLINYKVKSQRDSLQSISKKQNTFFIIKKREVKSDTIQQITKNFEYSKDFGKYQVYY